MNSPESSITIRVNGASRSVSVGASLAELLEQIGVAGQRIAVERNEDVIPRSEYSTTELQEGDRIEIIRAIGGG